jgi:hypothetical protein
LQSANYDKVHYYVKAFYTLAPGQWMMGNELARAL